MLIVQELPLPVGCVIDTSPQSWYLSSTHIDHTSGRMSAAF